MRNTNEMEIKVNKPVVEEDHLKYKYNENTGRSTLDRKGMVKDTRRKDHSCEYTLRLSFTSSVKGSSVVNHHNVVFGVTKVYEIPIGEKGNTQFRADIRDLDGNLGSISVNLESFRNGNIERELETMLKDYYKRQSVFKQQNKDEIDKANQGKLNAEYKYRQEVKAHKDTEEKLMNELMNTEQKLIIMEQERNQYKEQVSTFRDKAENINPYSIATLKRIPAMLLKGYSFAKISEILFKEWKNNF